MKVIQQDGTGSYLKTTLDTLARGGVVIFPSDTVYGLLVDAENEQAVKKLIAFKNRPPGKPISVFISDMDMLEEATNTNPDQKRILQELLPGPFTVVLSSKHTVSKLLESEKGTLGVRLPNYKPVNDLIKKYGKPVTATSANIGGRSPHYSVESLLADLSNEKKALIDLIVDGGKLPRNKPSTIIDLTKPEIKILRHGDVIWSDSSTYISKTPQETKQIAKFILERNSSFLEKKPLIFILQGDLGVGKTVFVKGLGDSLKIDNIISPTFVIYYEYDIPIPNSHKFIHADLYNIEDPEEFKYLHFEELLDKGNILAVEWGEKSGEVFEEFKKRGKVIYITMSYVNETERQIKVSY